MTGGRAATSTTSAAARSPPRSSAARTRTPGSPTSTSSDALDVDGLVAIYTYEDLPGRVAEPLPLLIPHPDLTHARTQYCAGQRRGEPRRRAGRHGRRHRPVRRRGRRRPDPGRLRGAAAGRRHRRRPRAANGSCTRSPRQRRARTSSGARRRRRGHGRRAARARPSTCTSSAARACRWRARACCARWDADDGPLRVHSLTQTSTACARRSPRSSSCRSDQVEVHRARRRRRLRRQDRAPVAGGAARAVGGDRARPAR